MQTYSALEDGPYVLYRDGQVIVKYVDYRDGRKTVREESRPLPEKDRLELTVRTDDPGKTFPVKLKTNLEAERVEYPKPGKLLVISDIEGNFRAFRKLLQASGVINDRFGWSFGDGHLVLTGDFVDRGNQVTEVLWLIYSLEEQAAAAGGHVHFILGNHEIMNLNGDLRYVNPVYIEHAALMKETFMQLFGADAELGRWLRTKNVMEKVGDILFVHGGISPELNDMNLSLARINKLARPHYDNTRYRYPDRKVELLYSDDGPFWYRGYYAGDPSGKTDQLDSTLYQFNVKHVSTGHTVIADTISVHGDGKLINTDVHHAKGHSEALLVEEGRFFRVNQAGTRTLLFEK